MNYKGVIKKSRTFDTAALIAVLGVVETNFGLMQGMLGQWYGLSYIVIAGLVVYLRMVTTGPVGQK